MKHQDIFNCLDQITHTVYALEELLYEIQELIEEFNNELEAEKKALDSIETKLTGGKS